jgi:hypothetical protein
MLNLSMAIFRKAIAIRRVSRGFVFAGWRRSFRTVFIFAFLQVFWGAIKKLIIRRSSGMFAAGPLAAEIARRSRSRHSARNSVGSLPLAIRYSLIVTRTCRRRLTAPILEGEVAAAMLNAGFEP